MINDIQSLMDQIEKYRVVIPVEEFSREMIDLFKLDENGRMSLPLVPYGRIGRCFIEENYVVFVHQFSQYNNVVLTQSMIRGLEV